MPPTPFHPTHDTPFKSSISSSQQTRKRNQIASDQQDSGHIASWPTSFSSALLDSRQWTYLAEGGKNLLLRYEGPSKEPFVHPTGRRIVLRLTKRKRRGKSDESGPTIDPIAWSEKILKRDLGDAAILPLLYRLEEDKGSPVKIFLQEMATKIETTRPIERRKNTGIEETDKEDLYITEDLSASIEGKEILSIEIKPKCGLLPSPNIHLSPETAHIKRTYSRYRMHRVLKSQEEPSLADFEDWYDPLDLYSGDQDRIKKASLALMRDWKAGQGNLRIFLDGRRIEADEIDKLNQTTVEGSFEDTLNRILSSSNTQSLLTQLLQLQSKYDNLDVEGVAALYQIQRGKELSQADEPEPRLEEYQAAIESDSGSSDYREAIVKLLLSAMYKDCSIFIRCISGESPLHYLVDLDPKPVNKLAYFEQIDKEICDNFMKWGKNMNLGLEK